MPKFPSRVKRKFGVANISKMMMSSLAVINQLELKGGEEAEKSMVFDDWLFGHD